MRRRAVARRGSAATPVTPAAVWRAPGRAGRGVAAGRRGALLGRPTSRSASRSSRRRRRAGRARAVLPAEAARQRRGPPGARPPLVVFCHGADRRRRGRFRSDRPVPHHPGLRGGRRRLRREHRLRPGLPPQPRGGLGDRRRRRLRGRRARTWPATGAVDGAHMAIRGSSAGGFTALCALARSRTFRAGTSLYGVTDLLTLSPVDPRLRGPLQRPPHRVVARGGRRVSPVAHRSTWSAEIDAAVLVLAGTDDPVGPCRPGHRHGRRPARPRAPLRVPGLRGRATAFAGPDPRGLHVGRAGLLPQRCCAPAGLTETRGGCVTSSHAW